MTQLLSSRKVSAMQMSGASIPDGETVTLVDDYTIWLYCADIPDSFGNLANVIANASARETLCNNKNALRYMCRSENIIMPAVLADSDWVTELDTCAYSIQIPTMTSATTPSGIVSQSAFETSYNGWHAFDKQYSTTPSMWIIPNGQHTGWVQYNFEKSVRVYRGGLIGGVSNNRMWKTVRLQCSSDGSTFDNTTGVINVTQNTTVMINFNVVDNHNANIWRLNCLTDYNDTYGTGLGELYLYGLDLS